ncbi:MAG: nucleotidyltransferase family protein [Chloroflexi bacterium]|nr:nucleotidyltransferase family protein [Chloroflexota bacterium]
MGRARIPIPRERITDFCRRNQVRSLALFGSVLRADFRSDSDVDLLVEFEPNARIGFLALGRMQRELTALLERPVDLVPKDGLKPLIRQEVLNSTEVIYAR